MRIIYPAPFRLSVLLRPLCCLKDRYGCHWLALVHALKNTIQEQIDRYFYRDRYDYRSSLTRFGRELSSHATVPVLVERLSQRLQKTLGVEPVEVFVRTRTEALEFESKMFA